MAFRNFQSAPGLPFDPTILPQDLPGCNGGLRIVPPPTSDDRGPHEDPRQPKAIPLADGQLQRRPPIAETLSGEKPHHIISVQWVRNASDVANPKRTTAPVDRAIAELEATTANVRHDEKGGLMSARDRNAVHSMAENILAVATAAVSAGKSGDTINLKLRWTSAKEEMNFPILASEVQKLGKTGMRARILDNLQTSWLANNGIKH